MELLIGIFVICIIYIVAFRDNFNKEDIAKALPFILVIFGVPLALSILGSILGGN